MARKLQDKGLIDTTGGGGGGGAFRSPKWMGQPRPTEMPQSKMDLRMEQRRMKQEEINRANEAGRASLRDERKKKFGINFKKGGMVKGQCRDYGK